MCCLCGWRGNHDEVKTFEYEREKTVHFEIDSGVVNKIVWQFYGMGDYEFSAVEGCCEDTTCLVYTIEGGLNDSLKDTIAHFRETGEHGELTNEDVLNVLCRDGWFDPGVYVVRVSL
jgi:hypothetical protein